MKWLNELKTDRYALREAKQEWRNKHFLLWVFDRLSAVIFTCFVLLVGYLGGAGLIDGAKSGVHTIGGAYLDDGSWNVIVDAGDSANYGRFWAKREYIECSYGSFAGPLIRRYWIGQKIESSRELSRLDRLEFEKFLTDYFGQNFRTFERESYDRKIAKDVTTLFRGCPFTANEALE